MEWSINDLARAANITSRTLRYYHDLGLLTPSRVARNGYRFYRERDLVELQRILLLRELGVPLAGIAEILAGQRDPIKALRNHLDALIGEREQVQRRIAAVQVTLHKLENGEPLMAEETLGSFDHTIYRDEVSKKWGSDAYRSSDQWWRSLSVTKKRAFQQEQTDIAIAYAAAMRAGENPESEQAQSITARHYQYVSTGMAGRRPDKAHFVGLGQLYVDDSRFTSHYDKHAEGTAKFIRDAMVFYARTNLS